MAGTAGEGGRPPRHLHILLKDLGQVFLQVARDGLQWLPELLQGSWELGQKVRTGGQETHRGG